MGLDRLRVVLGGACAFLLTPAWGGHLLRKQFRSSGQVKQSFTFTEEGVTVDFVDVDGERQVFRPWSAFHKLFSRFVEYGFAETWGAGRPAASDDLAQAEAG